MYFFTTYVQKNFWTFLKMADKWLTQNSPEKKYNTILIIYVNKYIIIYSNSLPTYKNGLTQKTHDLNILGKADAKVAD